MSSDDAEDRRGTEGRDLPLDVDARFAAIVAHFHDDEAPPPRLVDASPEAGDRLEVHRDDDAGPPAPADRDGDETADHGLDDDDPRWRAAAADLEALDLVRDEEPPEDAPAPPPRGVPQPPFGPRFETAAERHARIDREVERAVHGPDGAHFVPPVPPPLPRPVGLANRAAWTSVLVGPLLLLLCALFWDSVPAWVLGTLVVAVVAGFTYLVWRLPHSRDRDDPDDGAIV
ncbi:hypothetical protein [Aquipuribacter nitratireducens]|uniref:DUF308 domain-containing protein n=1 Tax=Aquipuribacter nitratireducens TaxID=650104 RepID=A0ABW0GSP3_9MICO